MDLRVGETSSGEIGQQSVAEPVRVHSLDAGRVSVSRREKLNPSRGEALSPTRLEEVSLTRRRFQVEPKSELEMIGIEHDSVLPSLSLVDADRSLREIDVESSNGGELTHAETGKEHQPEQELMTCVAAMLDRREESGEFLGGEIARESLCSPLLLYVERASRLFDDVSDLVI